jgi:hypothetical protein
MDGLDHEAFGLGRVGGVDEARTKDTVDGLLHGLGSATVFLFEERGYVVVDGESGSHIMMLSGKAS